MFKEVEEELGELEIGQACALTAAAIGISGCDPGGREHGLGGIFGRYMTDSSPNPLEQCKGRG